MPKASPIFHASSDDNDEGDFDYGGSPSARADRSRRNVERRPSQRREPVEHDEDIPPSPQMIRRPDSNTSSSSVTRNINITLAEANQHYDAMVGPAPPDVLLLREVYRTRLRRLQDTLGQVKNGTPEDVCIVAEYWNDVAEPKRRRGSMKNGVFEMQVDSEGVLINKALYLGRDQMYYYPKHYERTSPAGTGRMDTTQSAKVVAMGQFGKVYRAVDKRTEQIFAEKIVAIEKFSKNEISIHSQLEHDHIVRFFGVIRSRIGLHIFMQYAGGGSIQQILQNDQGFVGSDSVDRDLFSQYWSMHYYKQVLSAIRYLHSKNIVHCDIKPSNVVLSCDLRNCFLTDFGEAIIMKNNVGYHELQTSVGTPNYMSPEVIVDLQYHYASDIWSSACFLLHMLTGKVPWTKTYPGLGDYRYVIGDRPCEIIDEIPDWSNSLTQSILRSSFEDNPKSRKSVKELSQLSSKNLTILNHSRRSNRDTTTSIQESSESMEERLLSSGDAHTLIPFSNRADNEAQHAVAAHYNSTDVKTGVGAEAYGHDYHEISSSVSPKSLSLNDPNFEAFRDVEVLNSVLNSEPFSIASEARNTHPSSSNTDEVLSSSTVSTSVAISLCNRPVAEGSTSEVQSFNQNGSTEVARSESFEQSVAEQELADLVRGVRIDGEATTTETEAKLELNKLLEGFDLEGEGTTHSTSSNKTRDRHDQPPASGASWNGLDSGHGYQYTSSTYDQDVHLLTDDNQTFLSRECTADDVDERPCTSSE